MVSVIDRRALLADNPLPHGPESENEAIIAERRQGQPITWEVDCDVGGSKPTAPQTIFDFQALFALTWSRETSFRGRQHRNSESLDVHHHGLRRSLNLATNQAKSVVLSTTMPKARSAGYQETGSSGAREALQSNPVFGVIL